MDHNARETALWIGLVELLFSMFHDYPETRWCFNGESLNRKYTWLNGYWNSLTLRIFL